MVKGRGKTRSMLYLLTFSFAICTHAAAHHASRFVINDYYSQIAASGTQDGGICFPTRNDSVRPLLSTESITGPTAILSQYDPNIAALAEPFCLAATYRVTLANTAPLLQYYIPSSGSSAVGSLVITSGGVTFTLKSQSVTFPGGQFADGTFKQIQICVTEDGASLYLACGDVATDRPFSLTEAGANVSNGLVTFYRGVNMNNVFDGVVQQAYVIGLPNSTIVPYTLDDVVDIQCDALPAPPATGRSCAQSRQSLQALLEALTVITLAPPAVISLPQNGVSSNSLQSRYTVLHTSFSVNTLSTTFSLAQPSNTPVVSSYSSGPTDTVPIMPFSDYYVVTATSSLAQIWKTPVIISSPQMANPIPSAAVSLLCSMIPSDSSSCPCNPILVGLVSSLSCFIIVLLVLILLLTTAVFVVARKKRQKKTGRQCETCGNVQVFVTQLSGVTPFESVELNEEYEDANCSTSPAQSNICPGPIL